MITMIIVIDKSQVEAVADMNHSGTASTGRLPW